MKQLLDRPLQTLRLVLAGLFLGLLTLVGTVGLRNLERVERIRLHTTETDRLQRLGLTFHETLTAPGLDASETGSEAAPSIDTETVADLDRELGEILATHRHLDASTPRKLAEIRSRLSEIAQRPGTAGREAVGLFREILDAETSAEQDLLARIEASTRFELALSTALVVAAIAVAAAGWVVFRRRIRFAAEVLLGQQRDLARAERLAAAGEMAAGLAHELRNPLAGIRTTLANFRREMDDPDHRHRLSQVDSELERIARLVRDLLTQARQAPEPLRRLRLAPLVEDLLALVRYQAPRAIRLEAPIPPELEWELPEDRLRQSLLNLVLNALEALGPGPGGVTVAARAEGAKLDITVTDDGPGFPEEMLAEGIRPFHSTREEGTGLGLMVVRRMVAELGGEVRLANRKRGGAVVRLRLPGRSSDPAHPLGESS